MSTTVTDNVYQAYLIIVPSVEHQMRRHRRKDKKLFRRRRRCVKKCGFGFFSQYVHIFHLVYKKKEYNCVAENWLFVGKMPAFITQFQNQEKMQSFLDTIGNRSLESDFI